MRIGLPDGGEDGKYTSIGFVEISWIFAMQNSLLFGTIYHFTDFTCGCKWSIRVLHGHISQDVGSQLVPYSSKVSMEKKHC